jgi:FkbM family methyltransferase
MGFSLTGAVKKILTRTFFRHIRRSYSQSGEDIIICDLFSRLGIRHPTYLDIGANEPVALSNTYRLYTRGSTGVCVEPNPVLYEKLTEKRKRDIIIHAGVAYNESREADFYVFPHSRHGLNTFSKEEASFWEETGTAEIGRSKVEKIIRMKLVDINELMEQHFSPGPDFVSVDVEGLDLAILKTIDFNRFKPHAFCIETLKFEKDNKEVKNQEIISFLVERGYFIYADTYINTIFCNSLSYKNREPEQPDAARL